MLFIRSNNLAIRLGGAERLRLLDALAARGHAPLVRAARRRRFELLVGGGVDDEAVGPAADELERRCAARHESRPAVGAYTPGELFCAGDCVFFVLFGESAGEGLSAGIVYNVGTGEPLLKLDRFCRDVRETLIRIERGGESAEAGEPRELPCWKARAGQSSRGLARFIAIQPTDFAVAARCRGGAREFLRASELMESHPVRLFLRRVQEMRREGYTPRRLLAEANESGGVSVERMLEAGLLEREVRVSCRKSGHALFDLPTPDSLAAITLSKAKCSLCAAPVADEVVEETINPTWLAVTLLEDGAWLNNRVYKIIRSLGVPDSEIATGPASPHGESYIAAEVCGNSFLFVTRDGDMTPAFARRVAETVAETEAAHLVAVTTGAVEEEGRLRLYEFAWRRARDGRDLDITLVEGLDAARAEIERAFGRAVHRELARRLFPLDAPLGFGASNFVLDWFRLAAETVAKAGAAGALVPLFPDLDQRVAS
ncbi:MAG TPA: hypothetical protein VF538_10820 [Pyrinomonadaceae bacterium]|jgi:hypothetical protein